MVGNENKHLYINASVIICGGICLVRAITHFMYRFSEWNDPAIPGLSFLSDLCYPILYSWLGVLVRGRSPKVKWWIQVLVAVVSVYCFYMFCDWTAEYWYSLHLYIVMMGFGFLIPPRELQLESRKSGRLSLLMLAISAFCFTAMAVIKQRLLWGVIILEHPDMESMMEALVRVAEPLMAIVVSYFTICFAFSVAARRLGTMKWVRILAAIVCTLSFIWAISFFISWFFRWSIMAGYVYYYPILGVAIQPITILLAIALYRKVAVQNDNGEKLSWKEAFKVM